MPYKYTNTQIKQIGGKKITHKVYINNNNGFKSISHFSKGKHVKSMKKPLSKTHIQMIKNNRRVCWRYFL